LFVERKEQSQKHLFICFECQRTYFKHRCRTLKKILTIYVYYCSVSK